MNGYAFCVGQCCNCGGMITFNPVRVPSLRINGERQPLCEDCARKWIGLHPEANATIPPDAYQPVAESEL